MTATRTPLVRQLYFQVVVAIALGVALGFVAPDFAAGLKPLGDAFIKLVKMIIAPVIFLSVASGIGHMRELGAVGRVTAKAFAYFLTFSTLALLIGLAVGNIIQPGAGLHINPADLDASAVSDYVAKAQDSSITAFLTNIIPATFLGALAGGEILQVLFVAVLTGVALAMVGDAADPLRHVLDATQLVVFRIVAILMRAAPIGAFGAMAFTIGKFGVAALAKLALLVGSFYLTALLFVLVVLGAVGWATGFSIFKLIAYLKEELLLVLGTSSSESALPALMAKLEAAGCRPSVVGLVVP
ncbi:MAG: cation:dicarboxylate symporter family transporter, partial [Polymorphobacter sp.]